MIATGVQDFTQNLPPEITIIDAPGEGENYTDNFSISLNVLDRENDSYVLAIRLNNSNYSVDLSDCGMVKDVESEIFCEVDISRDLIPRPVNREDWRFEIIAVDDNDSTWTQPEMTVYLGNNFSIYWVSPMVDFEEEVPIIEQDESVEQNRALIWGVVGVIFGVVVAAGVMFRGFEKRVLDDVPPPFNDED